MDHLLSHVFIIIFIRGARFLFLYEYGQRINKRTAINGNGIVKGSSEKFCEICERRNVAFVFVQSEQYKRNSLSPLLGRRRYRY